MLPKGLVIAEVYPGSIAEEMEIQAGDAILAVNEEEVRDIIDFQLGVSEESFSLLVEKKNGEVWEVEIEREPGEFLGVALESVSVAGLQTCCNNCVFCFVAQMPPGMRPTLYQKDDDYRLSLTQGSYITLSNLGEEEIARILRLHLSPLYISVHAWSPEVRTRLMRNPEAGRLAERITRLAQAGIVLHTQIVLVPDYNDGAVLNETIAALGALYPAVQSIAVVPVGLTRYRERLTSLRGFTAAEAGELAEKGASWQKDFAARFGRHLVYLADEFYVLSGKPFPDSPCYDDFPQLENGVGMARKFISELEEIWTTLPEKIEKRRVHLVTGKSAQEFFVWWGACFMKRVRGLTVIVHGIENDFFGSSVTVAGLVTAGDIASQLGELPGEEFLLPRVMLKADEELFLDGHSVAWLEEQLRGEVRIVENNGFSFAEHVLGDTWEVECFE